MAAAVVSGAGSLVERYYATDDSTERNLIIEIVKRAVELDGGNREDLAVRIIEQLARRLSGKGRRPAR